ncbi:MAG: hypothetical protein WAM08_20900, partial [Candidatus Acidiferrales bacterium]
MVWAALALSGMALAAAKKEAPVDADAAWQPDARMLANLRKTCGDSSPNPGECLVRQMESVASPAAVAFTRSIQNEGWLRDFRKVARVDIAACEYPFRANQNQAYLLVNGTPPLVDVDNLQKLSKSELQDNTGWSKLIAQSPRAELFPGDRGGVNDPLAVLYVDGSQEFVVAYKVLDGCHACAQLGVAFLGFDFNPKGRFTGMEFLDLD